MSRVLPKISIVTPSYNQGQYIEQTIRSVLDQNYPNLEYIIIDGGSTDNTREIIQKYASRIQYWVSEKDSGQTEAINKGFEKCTGELFNWINSDDYYEPGTFMALAGLYKNNAEADVFCGREWGFQDDNKEVKVLHTGSVLAANVYETIRTGIIDQPCTFWRREAIQEFFPLDNGLRFVMDRQLWWSYLLNHGQSKIVSTKQVFTWFRLHSNSKTIGEQDYFEPDFDRLKQSLFRQLHAPAILQQQLLPSLSPVDIEWKLGINKDHVLAAFAFHYAVRNYVVENMEAARELMKLVKKWKGRSMTSAEQKMWVLCCLLPVKLLFMAKKLKAFIR